MSATFNRRSLFKAGAVALAAGVVSAQAPSALALGPVLGTIIDFAVGVPSPQAIKNAGHLGAIRYVSQRRPGTETWMTGKPVTLKETKANAALGLATASIYQFGRAETADWKQGAAGAAVHAPQAIAIHKAAGGPTNRPIYIAIDDNPTRAQYDQQIKPYLQAFSKLLSAAGYQTGVYGNYNTIEWCVQDRIGSFYWMHDWGSGGKIHPRTTIHQLPGSAQRVVDGVTVDINHVYARDWGQWTPGQAAPAPAAPSKPGTAAPAPAPSISAGASDALGALSSQVESMAPGVTMPRVDANGIRIGGSSVSQEQVKGAVDLISTLQNAMK
ncbi:TPA: DUF1906 domain-containing protein [Corynebacterium striatum]|nr:DUF1906 domain-containing protein [Corynebacterium striatum]